ncbi:haloacid dehalogenase-like hydrolase [Limibaculum sp. M0105]|uniref:phosphoserine phosphatase n=1 Tax=Thermohalobaculum xanthum TaxID=2753746 RepID=A0A8J7SCM5_9RHOB|nr:HAD family hydrolase [Thermohalobaculum xanthum]MBK0399527.1 haloacid dehalogenase-like hydrolase [Thermohalobaculum xanthum]
MLDALRELGRAASFGLLALSASAGLTLAAEDPLPSWNDGETKAAIVDFVSAVTSEGGADYVPPDDRIATFDNDGTLWSEQPMYVQLAFALDRIKAMAPDHPQWKETEPYKSVLAGDMKGLAASGKKGLLEIVATTHAGMSSEEFAQIAADWIATAKHPVSGKLYTEMIYAPMLELINYLKANDFEVFIVSGGGIEFMRPWTEKTYGIPPENVVGSSIKTKYEIRDGKPVIFRLPEIDFIDDGPDKPVGIQKFIGKQPIAAFGNSDGDFQMLEWTTAGAGRRLGMIVHHDDAKREVAYDRKSHIGHLDKALDAAPEKGWHLISMKDDWSRIFPD